MKKPKLSDFLLSILFVSILFSGMFSGPVAHAQQGPRLGGTFVIAREEAEPAALAPWIRGLQGIGVSSNILNGLVAYDAAYNPIPDLAQSWDISSDKLTWTFHLVKNATWHDGVPFTSADVAYTYNVLILLDPQGRTFFSKDDLDGVTAPDNYTAVFKWKHPFLMPLMEMNTWVAAIAPKHLYESTCPAAPCDPDAYRKLELNNKPIGTGPFKFQEWVRGDHITLVKNPNYFKKGLPYLDRIVFRSITEQATLISAMKLGEVDYVPDGVPYAIVDELNKAPAFNPVKISTTSIGQIVRLMFNLDQGPTKDVRVRQAISSAIDRQTIVDKATCGYTEASKSVWPDTPSMVKYRSPNAPDPKYDPAAAEQLLDDAGYKRGSDGVRFTLSRFVISTGEEYANSEPAALIKDMLKKVGIETTIVRVDESTKYKMMYIDRPRSFDIAMHRAKSGPDPYVTVKKYTSPWIIKATLTNIGYNNSVVDKIYDRIRLSASSDEQLQLYQQLDEIFRRDLPEAWIYDLVYAQPKRNTFQGSSFYDIISESGPIESIYWTQGTPITPSSVTTATGPTQAPALPWEWMATLVVVIIVLGGVYVILTRRKKKT